LAVERGVGSRERQGGFQIALVEVLDHAKVDGLVLLCGHGPSSPRDHITKGIILLGRRLAPTSWNAIRAKFAEKPF
jgi:hypothetical protein